MARMVDLMCQPGVDDPGCVTPQTMDFSQGVVDALTSIGLTESTKIDTNTPLSIIRHFANGQTYTDAFSWAWSFDLLVWVLFFIYGASRLTSNDFAPTWPSVLGVVRRCVYAITTVYLVSTSSVLLNDTQPLDAAQFVKFVLWMVSVVTLSLATFIYVEVAWLVGKPVQNFFDERSSLFGALAAMGLIGAALYLWAFIH